MKTLYKFGSAAAVSMSLLGTTAIAGNLSDPVVETVATPVFEPVAVGTDWTGAYGGLNLGYGDIDTNIGVSGDDMTYGLHVGYDYDFGQFVLGGELEYDKADIELGGGAAEVDSVTRLKLRGGYDLGRTLIYATGGIAQVDTSLGDENGEFIGVGVAYQVTDRFTVGGELLEHRFDDINGSGVDADATTFNLRGSFRF
jgi:predicted porin